MPTDEFVTFFLRLFGHHLWQGAALAIVLVALPARVRRWNSETRYWLCGLAIVAIIACAFFTAFSGASGVTPVMWNRGTEP